MISPRVPKKSSLEGCFRKSKICSRRETRLLKNKSEFNNSSQIYFPREKLKVPVDIVLICERCRSNLSSRVFKRLRCTSVLAVRKPHSKLKLEPICLTIWKVRRGSKLSAPTMSSTWGLTQSRQTKRLLNRKSTTRCCKTWARKTKEWSNSTCVDLAAPVAAPERTCTTRSSSPGTSQTALYMSLKHTRLRKLKKLFGLTWTRWQWLKSVMIALISVKM